MEEHYGQEALINIVVHLFFFSLTWWSLQALQIEKMFKKNQSTQIRLFYILLTITIGSVTSNFFLSYLHWTRQLPFLF